MVKLQAVQGTWIHTSSYGQFRCQWGKRQLNCNWQIGGDGGLGTQRSSDSGVIVFFFYYDLRTIQCQNTTWNIILKLMFIGTLFFEVFFLFFTLYWQNNNNSSIPMLQELPVGYILTWSSRPNLILRRMEAKWWTLLQRSETGKSICRYFMGQKNSFYVIIFHS